MTCYNVSYNRPYSQRPFSSDVTRRVGSSNDAIMSYCCDPGSKWYKHFTNHYFSKLPGRSATEETIARKWFNANVSCCLTVAHVYRLSLSIVFQSLINQKVVKWKRFVRFPVRIRVATWNTAVRHYPGVWASHPERDVRVKRLSYILCGLWGIAELR